MNMKKIAPITLSAILLGAASVAAEQPTTTSGVEQVEIEPSFIEMSGKISGVENRGENMLYMIDKGDEQFNIVITKNTLVFDKKGNSVSINEGDNVTFYVYFNQPTILIYPPQYSPAVAIVGDENEPNFVKVSAFDEDFVSEDNDLKLNIQEDTEIVNAKGEKITKDQISKQNAVVFYGPSTFSIPAQTSPDKVLLFPYYQDQFAEHEIETEEASDPATAIDAIIGDDFKMQGTTKMVPLRIVAEHLGYKVEATKNGAIISYGALSYTITRGEKMYGYNRALSQFNTAPALLEWGKTYVEYEFALELAK